jgi:hypothetical protein
VRRVLFDENVPRDPRRDLPAFEIHTVHEQGWAGLKNGQLLRTAVGRFDVLLTCGRSLQFQQNLPGLAIGVVVVLAVNNRLEHLRPLVLKIEETITKVEPGAVLHVAAS